jgi:hypothetical protein
VTGTVFRKLALSSCLALSMLGGATYTIAPAIASSIPGVPTLDLSMLSQNGGSVGDGVMNLLNTGNGMNAGQLAQIGNVLGSAPGMGSTASGTTANNFTQILSNLQSGGASPQAGANMINQMLGGAMTGQAGQALSTVQGLGNLAGQQGVQQLMSNPAVQQVIGQLPGGQVGANALAQVMQTAMQGGMTGNQLLATLGQTGVQAVAEHLLNSNPALANVFGALGGAGGVGTPSIASVAKGFGDAIAAVGNQDLVGGMTSLIGGLLGGDGFGIGNGSGDIIAGAASGAGGANSQGENFQLENKECPPYGATGCTQGAYGCACQTQFEQINADHKKIRNFTSEEFQKHRRWIIETYWLEHILPALMLMAEQLSVAGIQQVEMIGSLLDAKHQLETQRLFQQLTAEAHKDYQPSEGMCTFGSTVKSLATSDRKSDLVQIGLASRMMQRQTLSGDVLSLEGPDSDMRSRVGKFIDTYCDKADNANGLEAFCKDSSTAAARRNIDVDYTRNVEGRLTLEIDYTPSKGTTPTEDEEDLFALAANLYAHNIPEGLRPEQLANKEGEVRLGAAGLYMDLRSVFAKRSVAQNSFAAITSMRSEGDDQSAPYTKALLKELGITETDEIEKILGKKPSYFAQMEVLTKKLYQNPTFYTELYDKPVNVSRKGAALQAIGLMQDRDLYHSLLRSEAVLSVLLETMLMKEQEKIENAGSKLSPGGSQ